MVTYAFIASYMPRAYSHQLDEKLQDKVAVLVEELTRLTPEEAAPVVERFARQNTANVFIMDEAFDIMPDLAHYYDDTGQYVVDYAEAERYVGDGDDQLGVAAAPADGVATTGDSGLLGGTSEKYTTVMEFGVRLLGSDQEYTMVVEASATAINQAAEALGKTLPTLVPAILILAALVSWFYSRYITRPIVKLSHVAEKMSRLEFDWQADERRSDEIGALGASLNEMAARMDSTLEQLRVANAALREDIDMAREQERKRLAFFSAVSHELKTPLTIIKGQLEGMLHGVGVYRDREKYLARALEVAGTMEGLVQEILYLSRLESSGFAMEPEPLELGGLAQRAVAAQAELAERRGIRLSTRLEPGAMVSADEKLLYKAVHNLVSNAILYSPEGESVYITVSKKAEGVVFVIENTGVHIPEEALDDVFNAFYRVEQSRSRGTGGSGLGLYIVRMVMELHGLPHKIENTAAGVQFTFTMQEAGPPS